MTRDPAGGPLQPDELLRVMDAAAVVRARQEALDEHASFDRDATIREIQVMYEELGELVDREVIEQALEEYLSERRTFRPPPPTPATALAWMYVRRGMLARRVLAPALVAGALVWGGIAARDTVAARALEDDRRALAARVDRLWSGHRDRVAEVATLRTHVLVPRLPDVELRRFEGHLAAADSELEAFAASMGPLVDASSVPGDATRSWVDENEERLRAAGAALADAGGALDRARAALDLEERLESLGAEAERLAAAIEQAALEEGAAERARTLLAEARVRAEGRDGDALEATVDGMREILEVLYQAYDVVVTGGVWRYPNDDPDARNYYLVVRAVDADGAPVRVRIENEETGRVESVSEWGERVSKDVYDRIAADKAADGLIDEDHFGTKRRGFLAMERAYPELGRITAW